MSRFSAIVLQNYFPILAKHPRFLTATIRSLCFIFCMTLPMLQTESYAAPPAPNNKSMEGPPVVELTPEEQSRLAERFAPWLVFHYLESYFPCNPLFPFELEGVAPSHELKDGRSAVSILGTPESRTESYRALTLEEKARLAVIYYRAYPVTKQSEELIVVEYWLYYVQNTYRVRNNVIPVWFDGSHPNDLEHIHIVLKSQPGSTPRKSESGSDAGDAPFIVKEVYSSAHNGTTPANRYRYSEQEEPGQSRFLVELGSHAIAPDIDRDGLYTPGRDGDSGYKILWGIRDKGITWPQYNQSYMTPRLEQDSTIFSHASPGPLHGQESVADLPNSHFFYRLIPVKELVEDFDALGLTSKQREEVFENSVDCFQQAFGRSNGNAEKLLLPPDHEIDRSSFGIKDFSSTERGFLFGVTTLAPLPGVYLGGRYAFLHGIKYLPDLLFEADGILEGDGQTYLSTQALLTYPIDPSIKIMGGGGLITDSIRFNRRQWDWIVGGEIRLGDFLVTVTARSTGPIIQSGYDFRWSYCF